MNLKTTLRSAAIAAGVVMSGSFVVGSLMQPHTMASSSAHAFVIPSNLKGTARDSFFNAQEETLKIADAKQLSQAVKEHLDTCTWCKTGNFIRKPIDILFEQLLKLGKK